MLQAAYWIDPGRECLTGSLPRDSPAVVLPDTPRLARREVDDRGVEALAGNICEQEAEEDCGLEHADLEYRSQRYTDSQA